MTASRSLGIGAFVLSAILGGCRQVQDSLLYHPIGGPATPPQPPRGWTIEALTLPRDDGVVLRGWLVKPARRPAALLVYFGGNGEEVSWQAPIADRLGERALALVNYRGYGESTGRPSEATLLADALAVVDTLRARSDIDAARAAVMGRSLGSGVAVYVAAQRDVERVALISPYESIAAVASAHFPAALVRLVLTDRYDAVALAPKIRRPLLVVAAGRDDIIPVEHSRRFFATWGGEKRWVEFPQAGHNDLQEHAEYWTSLAAFLEPPAVR